jgi:hypothetical protein
MSEKSYNWMPRRAEEQLELPLPKRPGIATRRFADICPRCKCLHTDQAAVQACRSLVAQREQL